MQCPNCRKDVSAADPFCRFCGAKMPPAPAGRSSLEEALAALQSAVNSATASVDRAWKRAEPHVDKAANDFSDAAEGAWKQARPTIDSAMKSIDDAIHKVAASKPVQRAKQTANPVMHKASDAAKGAVKKAKPAVGKVAERAEGAARRVKERARR